MKLSFVNKFIGLLLISSLLLSACARSADVNSGTASPATAEPEATSATPEPTPEPTPTPEPPKEIVVKLGINGDESRAWKRAKEELAKEGIKLEIYSFADYIMPNTALADGEIDLNAFQTTLFMNNYMKESGVKLAVLGYTVIAPMGVYRGTTKSLEDFPDGGKIAIPNDVTNVARALIVLSQSGLIKVDESKGIDITTKDVLENPKNVQFVEMNAVQIPTVLDEVNLACVNSGVATLADLSPVNDTVFLEDITVPTAINHYNLIAAREEDKDRPELKRVVEVYQTDETKKILEEDSKGASFVVW